MQENRVIDDLPLLLDVLPQHIREILLRLPHIDTLLEVILDYGREPEARFPGTFETISTIPVTMEDLDSVVERIGDFGDDNRAGIPRTLHRISALRNRVGRVVGLTCRVGRMVYGTIDIIRDVVEEGHSLLLLGRPGVGKTTKLREMTRVLANELQKRVIVVDTSNEIAGDGDIPHPAIGRARRMQVPRVAQQHNVMIEAVENHMPEVIIIDEIGNEAEAMAARTIAERGVQLIATAHGTTLDNLMQNPTLNDLVGGIQAVTLSDEEARRRGTQKTVLERKSPPTFDVLVEMVEQDKLAVYHNLADIVDRKLRGGSPAPEMRILTAEGDVEKLESPVKFENEEDTEEWGDYEGYLDSHKAADISPEKSIYIFPYGVARNKLERAINEIGVNALIARRMEDADVIIAVKQQERRDSGKLAQAMHHGVPVHIIRNNTYQQIMNALYDMYKMSQNGGGSDHDAIREAREAIREVLATSRPIELSPRNAYQRRLQHKLAMQYHLHSESVGTEPMRHVRICK